MLLPSVKEGWGLAIMEAAAQGTPTLAYRSAGGVTESIVDGETGLLVDDLGPDGHDRTTSVRHAERRRLLSDGAREQHAATLARDREGLRARDRGCQSP